MDTPSNRAALPRIKPRFFLRRWVDRVALACIVWTRDTPMPALARKTLERVPAVLYFLPLLLLGATCLVGMMVTPPDGLVFGLLASALLWPVRWAVGPWVRDPDENTVRILVANQYQLIQDFTAPDQLEQIVAWAAEDPWFDTRHLLACMDDDYVIFRSEPFIGENALDLFDGLVGRRVAAIRQGWEMEVQTPSVEEPEDAGAVRRL